MTQLTIRGFDEDLDRHIRELSRRYGISLNKTVLRLLRRGAGLDQAPGNDRVGTSLDDLIGTWTDEEADALDRAVADFERVDPKLWR